MNTTHETNITREGANKLVIHRSFSASLDKVWRAWTESALLDQWWAPRPYKAETKSINFTAGGRWLYAMVSPDGEKHWCRVDISTVAPQKSFAATAGFCDEDGNPVDVAPPMHWHAQFSGTADGCDLHLEVSFDSEEDLARIVEMGFKEGFTMALQNLDEILA